MMVTAEKIKEAINLLPEKEYVKLREWFPKKNWKNWDKKIKQDSEEGKLDFLIEEALNEKNKGTLSNL